jgi:hypothetical protein
VFASGLRIDVYGARRLATTALTGAQVGTLARSARPAARLVAVLANAQADRLGGRHQLGDAGAVARLVADLTGEQSVSAWAVRQLAS